MKVLLIKVFLLKYVSNILFLVYNSILMNNQKIESSEF